MIVLFGRETAHPLRSRTMNKNTAKRRAESGMLSACVSSVMVQISHNV